MPIFFSKSGNTAILQNCGITEIEQVWVSIQRVRFVGVVLYNRFTPAPRGTKVLTDDKETAIACAHALGTCAALVMC